MTTSLREGATWKISNLVLVLCLVGLVGCRSAVTGSRWVFEPEARPISNRSGLAPQLLVLTSGDIFAIQVETKSEQDHDLGFYSSSTDGDIFTRTLQLNGAGNNVHPHLEGTPLLRVGRPGAYYAFWTGSGEGPLAMELMYSRSMNFGHSFSHPVALDAQNGGNHPYFNAAAIPDGTVLVVWIAYEQVAGAVPGTGVLNMIRSTDSGNSFSPPQRIATNVCPCCRPELKADGQGNWYLAWRHVDSDQERDIVVVASHDRGATWSPEVRVSHDGWHIKGCPDSGPSLTSFQGRIFVAWHTVVDGEQRLFWAESSDGGRQYTARRDLGLAVHDPNHPYLANVGGHLIAVFQGRDRDQRAGWDRVRIYFREIAPSVNPALTVLPDGSGSATYPIAAALGPREIIVAWTDISKSGSRVLCVRGHLEGPMV